MLLVIDVGNTNIVFGVYKEEELIHDFRVATVKTRTSDEYGLLFLDTLTHANIDPHDIENVIISSVVPNVMHTLPSMVIKYFNQKPMIVSTDLDLGLNIQYDNPKEVGADRLVNAVAAIKEYGGPCIIIDIGTAMTFCVVDQDNQYLGGMIMPGIGISADALFNMTSKLPKIEIIRPDSLIGTNTISSMQSGLYYGFKCMIDGILEMIMAEKGWTQEEVTIISTGGFSTLLTGESQHNIVIDRDLTLKGLLYIFNMNKETHYRNNQQF